MQLLAKLPQLPFSVAFDILFRHGGFAAFADAHGPEAAYQFWRMYFVSSPVGKLRPKSVGQWVEVMCICHVVNSLPHPAHSIYLLRPVCRDVPESVAAWTIAGGRGNQMRPPELLIRAMRIFLSRQGDQPMLQREWFPVSDLFFKRSVSEWRRFADEVISNHLFTRYWWRDQKEGPFYLLGAHKMDEVLVKLAHRDTAHLKQRLRRVEAANMLRRLRAKRAREHKPIKTSLTSSNKQEIEHTTSVRCSEHESALSRTRRALASMMVVTLENRFGRVLRLVTSVYRKFPRIKWSIKLALHEYASETCRSVWEIERELHRVRYSCEMDPLAQLESLACER